MKVNHQQLLRDWQRQNGPCIVCGERTANERDHLPPRVLYPKSLRDSRTELLTFPVCTECNRSSSDEDFLFSVLLSLTINQPYILRGQEPVDPDFSALYKQTQDHFEHPTKSEHRSQLLEPYLEQDPVTGQIGFRLTNIPISRTLTKIVKSIYWSATGGQILESYNPGWWIRSCIDTSKRQFIEKHLKTTDSAIHWGNRFISRHTIGYPADGVGGLITCSLHFYTKRALSKGLSWFVIAAPRKTTIGGQSLYELCRLQFGKANIEPKGERTD